MIFGVDRATGMRCELPSDPAANMENETINLGDYDQDEGFMDEVSKNDVEEEVHQPSKKQKIRTGKGKARAGSSTPTEEINEINHMSSHFAGFMDNISTQLGRMTTTMNQSNELERMTVQEASKTSEEARKAVQVLEAKQ